jgi:hypothetical protein
MPIMTWIATIPPDRADPTLRQTYDEVRALYPPEYSQTAETLIRPDGTSDSVVQSQSLIPEALRHGMSAFGVLLAPDLPLSRRQHEMIATLVSALNRCVY